MAKKNKLNVQEFKIAVDLFRLKHKMSSMMIIGVSGNIRGLSLLCSGEQQLDMKLIAGNLAELSNHIEKTSNNLLLGNYTRLIVQGDFELFMANINDKIRFVAILQKKKQEKQIIKWLAKNDQTLKVLFS